jgi:ubiquitin-protein ligase
MAMGSQQLAEDYEQLKELLELYPNIAILKTEGQPPDNYEIEYKLRGFVKDAAQSIGISDIHKIRISLPFGYPHFAPIAKPLTAIFHPDFDPAAIRIAERWQQNPSLSELVLHIGEMISGTVYNVEDPFNQEAADWYKTHKNQLPLDSLSIADIEESIDELDSLVDDTFASLGLENDDFLKPEKTVDASEIEYIRQLITQNKFFTANKLLTDIPVKVEIPDRDELQQTIGKVLRKTDQLFKLAEQLEEAGKNEEALEVTDNLLAIASDTPGIDALRGRIQQSFFIDKPASSPPKKKEELVEKKPEDTTKKTAPALPKSLAKPAFWEAIPYKPFLAIALILLVCIGTLSLYFKDQNVLSQSQANILKGQLLIEKKQFEPALETLEGAKSILGNLTVLRFRKNALEQEINKLIGSPDLREGLKGRVRYQSEYIPVQRATALNELAVLTDQAQALVSQNKGAEALVIYRQAFKYAADHDLAQQQAVINETIQTLELRLTLISAEKAEQGKNWEEAADAYRKALNLSGKLKTLGTTDDITQRLTAAAFRHEMDQSKKAFTQSQWQETIKFLEQAQKAMTDNPNIATNKERQELHKLLVNAQLYLMLSTAREAYQQKNWGLAITEYQNALTLLAGESETLENSMGESIAKIEKTLLLVNIAQLQEKVLLAEGKSDGASVIAACKEIIQLIRSSNHGNDPAVKAVTQKINEKIVKQQDVTALNEKIAWLEEHYEEIFRANYPTFQGSKLLQPKAVFLKKIDNKSIFTITCLERGQGSSSKLELNYMIDPATGKWSVYHGH